MGKKTKMGTDRQGLIGDIRNIISQSRSLSGIVQTLSRLFPTTSLEFGVHPWLKTEVQNEDTI